MSFSDMEAAFADSPPSSSCASSGSGSRSPSPETVPFEGFEGPEKKLEIEFDVPADDDCGLRVVCFPCMLGLVEGWSCTPKGLV